MVIFPKTLPNALRAWLRHLSIRFGHALFPWRTRRRIFLSSVYGMTLDLKKQDAAHADRLARVLNISRDHRGMEFPVAIKSMIWYKINRNQQTLKIRDRCFKDLTRCDLTNKENKALALHIAEQAPVVLQYAKPSQMAYDIECLAKYLRNPFLT